MERYPTPPSTSSPGHTDHRDHAGGQDLKQQEASADERVAMSDLESYPSHARVPPPPQLQLQLPPQDAKKSPINSTSTTASTIVPSSPPNNQKPLNEKDIHVQNTHDSHSISRASNLPPRTDIRNISAEKAFPHEPAALKRCYSDDDEYPENDNRQSGARIPTHMHRPAQETYWVGASNSDPVSPSYMHMASAPGQDQSPSYSEQFNPSRPTRPGPPPRRSSSPIPASFHPPPSAASTCTNPYYHTNPPSSWNPPTQTPQPHSHPPPQPHRRHSSPYTPYTPSRPLPRPGLLKRTTQRLQSWLSSLSLSLTPPLPSRIRTWMQENLNPLLKSITPLLILGAGAGISTCIIKGMRAFLEPGHPKKRQKQKKSRSISRSAHATPRAEQKWHEEIFSEFQGFAGSKGGPLDGFLMMLYMLA
ncbi:hypothetical protein DSL72_002277 [Monilinia vaccinii-corymbosi]|uniref:Uncharacterized protein n=1 Tax=Monilinia vaccinii-corymbosi TaxID=61207 RepID=A0A8A3PC96_9HELO|nr:hypothetical protein DSL72_002277 [Monilinia vaccinii-corymbosi]